MDILKHLAQRSGAPAGHPNVLAYIDSWEEDEALFIQTELCESGSLAHFLWEYGRVFPRLDEARVWKIIVDLSNVSHVCRDFKSFSLGIPGPPFHSWDWSHSFGSQTFQRFSHQGWSIQDWRFWNGLILAKETQSHDCGVERI